MSATESAEKNVRCANVGGLGSVGGVSSWVRGSNTFWRASKNFWRWSKYFGVGQIFFGWVKFILAWVNFFFFFFFLKVGQNLLDVSQSFFGVGQIVRIADLYFL